MTKTAFYTFTIRFFIFAGCGLTLLPAQTTSQTSFGKNRVQYNRQIDEWMLYETANFVTYWYGDARNIAQSALQTAEYDFSTIQQMLEHQMTEKVEMLVFSDLTDLKQSNIGEDEVFQLRAGETKVVGNKVFVYFDGDHNHLRAQIREGVAGVLLNSMLFGANLQEIVQNAVLLNLPGWYTNGLTAYCGEEWSTELDNQLRDLIQSGKYKNFDKIAKEHPRVAGHAFWNYIGLHYGRSTISNLLYLTRINRSIDAGFLYVLGNGYRRTTDAMLDYYRKRYRDEVKITKTPDPGAEITIKNKKKLPLNQLKISPDGRKIAWVSNDIGKWRVWTLDLETGKRKLLFRGGVRNALQATDYNYPQIAWNPDNQRLAVLYERRDVPRIAVLHLATGKKEYSDLSPEFQRVFSMEYVNPVDIAMSAAVRGYSDLFIYHTVNRQTERLTQDFWDDLDASVTTLDGQKGILFASNRLTDTLSLERLDTVLPIGRFDIFFFNLDQRSNELVRITQTPFFDERNPIGADSTHFLF
ncbi:MAG: PD40 domain-containing protein [Lewinellaceae bacterium]|nr:PD40 domain-containing protein [Lewinellaceae bacterium]